jgi:hypothetical protein
MAKNLTVFELYSELNTKKKVQVRDAYCTKFETSDDTFYQKIKNNRFKTVEIEFVKNQITIAANEMTEVLKQS